jgi:hypothetical protein
MAKQWLLEAKDTPNFVVHAGTEQFILRSNQIAQQRRYSLSIMMWFSLVSRGKLLQAKKPPLAVIALHANPHIKSVLIITE